MTQSRQPPQRPASGVLSEETQRMLRSRMRALRLGATCCAALGGVACYALLAHLKVPEPVAVVVGLVFAVLGRMALASLATEWLVATARRTSIAKDSVGPEAPDKARRGTVPRR